MELKVVRLPVENRRSVNRVLAGARAKGLTDVIIIGYDANGELWTDVNLTDGGDILWMLEWTKGKLLQWGNRKDGDAQGR